MPFPSMALCQAMEPRQWDPGNGNPSKEDAGNGSSGRKILAPRADSGGRRGPSKRSGRRSSVWHGSNDAQPWVATLLRMERRSGLETDPMAPASRPSFWSCNGAFGCAVGVGSSPRRTLLTATAIATGLELCRFQASATRTTWRIAHRLARLSAEPRRSVRARQADLRRAVRVALDSPPRDL